MAADEVDTDLDQWCSHAFVRHIRSSWEAMSVVHFILVFRDILRLEPRHMLKCAPERALCIGCSPEDLTYNLNDSVPPLNCGLAKDDADDQSSSSDDVCTGNPQIVFDALVHFLASQGARRTTFKRLRTRILSLRLKDRVVLLKSSCEEAAEQSAVRGAIMGNGNGASAKSSNSVPGGVRLSSGARDSKGRKYVWIHGMDGCASGRVELAADLANAGSSGRSRGCRENFWRNATAKPVVIEGAMVSKVADVLEVRGAPKTDRVCSAWIREKTAKSAQRAAKVEKAAAAQEKKERRHISNLAIDTESYGRGRRRRQTVNYAEELEPGEDIGFSLSDADNESEHEENSSSDESVGQGEVDGSSSDVAFGGSFARRKRAKLDDDFCLMSDDEESVQSSDLDGDKSLEDIEKDEIAICPDVSCVDPNASGRGARRLRRSLASAASQDSACSDQTDVSKQSTAQGDMSSSKKEEARCSVGESEAAQRGVYLSPSNISQPSCRKEVFVEEEKLTLSLDS